MVEQLGSGMSRILKVYDENIFHFTSNFLIITFPFAGGYNGIDKNETVNETVNSIIKIIAKNKNVSIKSIVDETGKSRTTITRLIKELKEKGKLQRVGSDKKGYWELK